MATRGLIKQMLLVTWFITQSTTAAADGTEDPDIQSNLIDGLDQIAKDIGRYFTGEKPSEKTDSPVGGNSITEPPREPKILCPEDLGDEEKGGFDSEGSPTADGRVFIAANGFNGTTYTLNLQALTAAFGTAILIGLTIVIILLIIALATGRDISYVTKSIMDAADPFYYNKHWYNKHNYYDNYDNYREQSTYEYYRAFEEAAKRYAEENQL